MQKPLNPVLPLKHVLPYPINTVLIEDFVLSNNGHRFDMRLGDEHAVERVMMVSRQFSGVNSMIDRHSQGIKAFSFQGAAEIRQKILRNLQFSGTHFDRDFPRRRRTYIQLVARQTYCMARPLR